MMNFSHDAMAARSSGTGRWTLPGLLAALAALALVAVVGCSDGGLSPKGSSSSSSSSSGGIVTPTVTIAAPTPGASISGDATVSATLSSTTGVSGVVFKVNGTVFAQAAPAASVSSNLNTLGVPNGSATVSVETQGNAASASVSVTVSNPRTLYVRNVHGVAGSSVTVRVLLNDVANAAGFSATLQWDAAKLTLDATSVKAGADVPAGTLFTKNTATAGQLVVAAAGTDAFTNTAGGEVLTANFTIVSPSASGTQNAVTMSAASLSDTNGNALTVASGSGAVITQ